MSVIAQWSPLQFYQHFELQKYLTRVGMHAITDIS